MSTVIDLIDKRSAENPEGTAITCNGRTTSYRALMRTVDAVAETLRRHVGERKHVVIVADRSDATAACILAALRTGAVCVPVYEDYPRARIENIVAAMAGDIAVVITGSKAPTIDGFEGAALSLEDLMHDATRGAGEAPHRPSAAAPDDTAYVLFTSGSTGVPKGVEITHRALLSAVAELIFQYDIGQSDRVLHAAPLGFDTSMSEILRALCSGATLTIADSAVTSSPKYFFGLEFLEAESVTRAVLPAALLARARYRELPALQLLVTTGEACTKDVVEKWAPGRRLLNAWGSTESTFSGTIMDLSRWDRSGTAPIGRANRNCSVFVARPDGSMAGTGEEGELFITGENVARGYYRNPSLTRERFLPADADRPHPTFRTRDRGRLRSDGYLECLGRADSQVKIRGYRVDLTEVEDAIRTSSSLLTHQVVVVAVDRSQAQGQELVAFITAANEVTADGARRALNPELARQLPDYAIPNRYVPLDRIPLNAHGKIDRRALVAGLSTGSAQQLEARQDHDG
ncbi:amino acid adenylation domain-containing protein [Streptomyces sp. NPDC046805]|uniref:amino acid adenylation domain-containing protein n=1 Tax=Streptomyces sp. NPDC046805 TaxID=3155134 RepID=UPI0033F9DAEF